MTQARGEVDGIPALRDVCVTLLVRVRLPFFALFSSLAGGFVVYGLGQLLTPTDRISPEHLLFSAAWVALCLRFMRSSDRWMMACDLACLCWASLALVIATTL